MNVNSSSYDNNVFNLIKKDLDATSLRSKVIANNIANVNTKNYKSYNVSFEDTLNKSVDDLELKTTDSRHIKLGNDSGDISITQDNSTSMNNDGNNVDIDNEMANEAANTLMYNAMITEVSNKISNESYVITGGGR